MDYNAIDYFFDDIDSFYAELSDVIKQPFDTEDRVHHITSQYIQLLVRFQKDFITDHKLMAKVAYKLIDSTFYLEHSTTILSDILKNFALPSMEDSQRYITYSLLLYTGKEDARWMQYIVSEATLQKRNRLLCKIMDELTSLMDNRLLMSIALSLAFEMGKVAKFRKNDIALISLDKINFLLDLVESTRNDSDESFNYDIIQLLLVFNEQFMMAKNQINWLVEALVKGIESTATFGENLIFMLNRSNDTCNQLLILKLLYSIFTEPKLYEYFYTNDLYVLVDIILREVCDLGDDKESETLRDAYLRILKPLLINTQLRRQPYKKNEIHQVICSLITPYMDKQVEPSSKRLAQRILEDWYEQICQEPVAPVLGVHVHDAVIHSNQGFEHAAIIKQSSTPTPTTTTPTSLSPTSTSTSSLSSSSPSSESPAYLSSSSLNTTTSPTSASVKTMNENDRGVVCS
ncbi:unnamed protein product [Cunninghamella echinulata]